jgi:hypothetical protein
MNSNMAIEPQSTTIPDFLNRSIGLRSMFMRPRYTRSAAGIEQAPFIFWLVEALRPRNILDIAPRSEGVYFSACQAVQQLGLETSCRFVVNLGFARDNPEAIDAISDHNEVYYPSFSTLEVNDSTDAETFSPDESVDLLILNLSESAKSDLKEVRDWISKLSSSSVIILLHLDRKQGAVPLLVGLKETHPHLEFWSMAGVTILRMGSAEADLLDGLFLSEKNSAAKKVIVELFAYLGRACKDAFVAQEEKRQTNELRVKLNSQIQEAENSKRELDKVKAQHSVRTQELLEVRANIERAAQYHASERGQMSERITMLQELREEMRAELVKTKAIAEAEVEKGLGAVGAIHQSEIAHLKQQMEFAKSEAALEIIRTENVELKASLEEMLQRLQKTQSELERQNTEADQQIEELMHEIQSLKITLAQRDKSSEGMLKAQVAREAALGEYVRQIDKQARELQELQAEVSKISDRANDPSPTDTERNDMHERQVSLMQTFNRMVSAVDSIATTENGYVTMETYGQLLVEVGAFESDWYLSQNQDISNANMDPLEHYMKFGAREGRLPRPLS